MKGDGPKKTHAEAAKGASSGGLKQELEELKKLIAKLGANGHGKGSNAPEQPKGSDMVTDEDEWGGKRSIE